MRRCPQNSSADTRWRCTARYPLGMPEEQLTIRVLGRTLEHLGVQMYKRRDVALAELVANAWDAGASRVEIELRPQGTYDQKTSNVIIRDDGIGMTFDDIRDHYLVVGRDRREARDAELPDRPPMGRKGIGKLAGFGIASKIDVLTWRDGRGIEFTLDADQLKVSDGVSEERSVPWKSIDKIPASSSAGTRVRLSSLKHTTPLDIDRLWTSLARRFSRRVQGQMQISVNGKPLPDPTPPLDKRIPGEGLTTKTLDGGKTIQYWYGFATGTIKNRDLRGFTIQVRGKTAQAPPFFFDVEATASGQHATRYVIGEIIADYVDDLPEDAISTDRQELEWDNPGLAALWTFGDTLSRKALIDCTMFKGKKTEEEVLEDPELRRRIEALDNASQKQIKRFLKILGPCRKRAGGGHRARGRAAPRVRVPALPRRCCRHRGRG